MWEFDYNKMCELVNKYNFDVILENVKRNYRILKEHIYRYIYSVLVIIFHLFLLLSMLLNQYHHYLILHTSQQDIS